MLETTARYVFRSVLFSSVYVFSNVVSIACDRPQTETLGLVKGGQVKYSMVPPGIRILGGSYKRRCSEILHSDKNK